MKTAILNIQGKISNSVPDFKYIDEDWGQLGYYSPNFPVQWPVALIDISGANFSDIGRDLKSKPINRQMATASIKITVANLKLTNSSHKAPSKQKNQAFSIWELIDKLHEEIEGFCPDAHHGGMSRQSLKRIIRDDGVQQYDIIYTVGLNNV